MNDYVDYNEHKFIFLHGQKAPSAVFIGTSRCELMEHAGLREVKEENYDAILQTVEQLRKHNIDAVPTFSELALDPSKTVVTGGGIQTPVLKPDKLEEAAKQIFEALDDKKLQEEYQWDYKGYSDSDFAVCSPVDFSQMASASGISQNIYRKIFEPGLTHPDSDEFVRLREQYGFDLEYELISGIKAEDLLPIEKLQEDNQYSIKSLYRGGCLGDTPYVSFAARENKAFAYSTPKIDCATMYSGLGDYGVRLLATSSEGKESIKFGLIYEFEPSPTTVIYGDWGMEQGAQPYIYAENGEIKSSDQERFDWRDLETAVTSSQNKLKNIYVHLRKDGKDVFYPIPLNDKKWRAFLALYRSSDTCLRGYMIERRTKILKKKQVFSSLNNIKKYGLFKTKVRPVDFGSLDREDAIRSANLTIEEKKLQNKKNNFLNKERKSDKDIAAIISRLRHPKAYAISVAQRKQIIPRKQVQQLLLKIKKSSHYS